MRKFLRYLVPPLAWMGLIFFLSAQPDLPHAPSSLLDLLLKKTAHALVYGVLTWLYLRALSDGRGRPLSDRLRLIGLLLALLYAASDEYHQTFVPGRNGHWPDVVVDGVGGVIAVLVSRSMKISPKSSS
jgi:VanZ family protein